MKRSMSMFMLFGFLLAMPMAAWATNGMEMTASGARAAGMGGVDYAIAIDSTAINTNPAGLIQLEGHRIDLGAGLLMPSIHFKNDLNDEDSGAQYFPLPVLSYGYRLPDAPWAFGLGVFAQGGMGADFELDNALLGDKQEYSSNIAYMKIAPAFAYQPHERVSIGFALNIGYAQMAFKMPYAVGPSIMRGVADPSTGMTFGDMFAAPMDQGGLGYTELVAGAELENATAFGWGAKLGFLFKLHDDVSMGIAYTTPSKLTFNGDASMDMTAQFNDAYGRMVQGAMSQGLSQEAAQQAVMQQFGQLGIDPTKGFQADYDAEIDFWWPQKLGIGFAFTPTDNLLLGVDLTWINWSQAMRSMTMKLTNGTNDNINTMLGGDEVRMTLPLNWNDQYVLALGAQYQFIERLYGRVGYNYGKNPVPEDTVFPVFPAVVEHHVTAGLGYGVGFFEINAAYEHAFAKTVEADNTHLVGSEYAGSESTLAEDTAFMMLSFSF